MGACSDPTMATTLIGSTPGQRPLRSTETFRFQIF